MVRHAGPRVARERYTSTRHDVSGVPVYVQSVAMLDAQSRQRLFRVLFHPGQRRLDKTGSLSQCCFRVVVASGKHDAGGRVQQMVSNYDLMPTLVNFLGFEKSLTNSPESPGRDFSEVLRGDSISNWVSEVFYEFEFLKCIRTDEW